ncbi:PqqD family protein [Methylocystis echinoides]|uniref:PqqD family protein n=1 Tax=Methylocystis echinoides TaxID=29468 RepID=A0A9W6LS40_9HYPH|nr:PqqD family protein [Methylocystis echinoides]GLI93051.1 hypothetical protein LMG27198_20430 [Methylocystis echinoides]
MQPDCKRVYKRVEGVEFNETHDGMLVYDETGEKVHFVNLTASAILELCDGETDVEDMTNIMQEAFDLPAPPVEEVNECVTVLLSQGLIRVCGQS